MAKERDWSWLWVVFVVVMVGLGPCLASGSEIAACLVPAEQWPWFGPNRAPRWEVEALAPLTLDGRDVLVLHDRYVQRRRSRYAQDQVDRITVFDRATGEKLGQAYTWDHLDAVAEQGGRLWVEAGDSYRALSLPALQREAELDDLVADHPEFGGEPEQVHFPAETDNVRLVMPDGFLWDLYPDLATVQRLHHDTALPRTPDFGIRLSTCPQEVSLDTERTAMLGRHSQRPALRVTDQRRALEAAEVETRHEGFLGGAFLCVADGAPVLRPGDNVFITHAEERAGERLALLSRVSMTGLVWTRATADWLPAGLPEAEAAAPYWVEDRGDSLVILLRSDRVAGAQALVSVDPETGDARWVALP